MEAIVEIDKNKQALKMIEIYDQIQNSDDIALKTAALLTVTNSYSYAMRISNVLNDRQGRNRITVKTETAALMRYSLDVDVNEVLDKQLMETLIEIINIYLSDKQELPSAKPKISQGIVNRVKALMIMLISSNQYTLIPVLNTPTYMLKYNAKLFESLMEIREDILKSWIEFLESTNNHALVDIVKQLRNDFWGSDSIKPNVIWDRYFSGIEINDEPKVYQAFLEFRAEYRKATKNILPSRMYNIYEITPDAYNNARKNVYSELNQLFPEYKKNITTLIYE